ncbi:MAG: sarcosine oxidase, partial [uncultured Corynebacteriales bacterium]
DHRIRRDRPRNRWDGQRRRVPPGPAGAARPRPGPVRPGARAGLQPRRLPRLPAVLLRGPGVRAAAAAGLGPVARAGPGLLRPHRRPLRRRAGRGRVRRVAAVGRGVGAAARGARPDRGRPPVPDLRAPPGRAGPVRGAGRVRPPGGDRDRAPGAGRGGRGGAAVRRAGPVLDGRSGRGDGPDRHRDVLGRGAGAVPGRVGARAGRRTRADGGGAAGHALGGADRPDRPVAGAPGLHLRRRPRAGLRLPGDRRPGRRGEGVVLPGRRADHPGHRGPDRTAGGGGRAAGPGPRGVPRPGRAHGPLDGLLLHHHPGRALRPGPAPGARQRGRGLRVLRPRLQVRPGGRGDPGRPRPGRRDPPPDRPVRPAARPGPAGQL